MIILIALVVVLGLAIPGWAADAALFTQHKCNECHAVAALGIELVEADDDEESDDPFGMDDSDEEDEEGPDLSGIGKTRDAEWLAKYLKKKVKHEESGKKHRKRFKGSTEELDALVKLLVTFKTDTPAE